MLVQLLACLIVIFASLHALFRMVAHHAVLILMVGFLAGCGLSGVQKVKLACAESAETLAAAYRGAKGAELPALDARADSRAALCNESMYRSVESGAGDVPRLVEQIKGAK